MKLKKYLYYLQVRISIGRKMKNKKRKDSLEN